MCDNRLEFNVDGKSLTWLNRMNSITGQFTVSSSNFRIKRNFISFYCGCCHFAVRVRNTFIQITGEKEEQGECEANRRTRVEIEF